MLLKSIIKAALRLTASNTTFGCNPYLQNIDVMKNKDVELTDWKRVLEKERIISKYSSSLTVATIEYQ